MMGQIIPDLVCSPSCGVVDLLVTSDSQVTIGGSELLVDLHSRQNGHLHHISFWALGWKIFLSEPSCYYYFIGTFLSLLLYRNLLVKSIYVKDIQKPSNKELCVQGLFQDPEVQNNEIVHRLIQFRSEHI